MLKWNPKVHGTGDVEVYATMNLEEFVPHPKGYTGNLVPAGAEDEASGHPFGWRDERGVGVVEIILILVVLIALVTMFKGTLSRMVQTILDKIENGATQIMN